MAKMNIKKETNTNMIKIYLYEDTDLHKNINIFQNMK